MAKNEHAYGFCDRSGWRYPLKDLVEEYVQGVPTGMKVGRDIADEDHPQNWVGLLGTFDDPHALEGARPDPDTRTSRAMASWDPAGVGNLEMEAQVGRATAS